ncbi:MAG: hypothetical protein JNK20_09525 [Flavipsychrobacter sp.]|nr:hypothetical protein [Flavipsychrobacter sp.]
MSGIHLVLLATGLIGMFPLFAILWKRSRFLKLMKNGIPTNARIYEKRRAIKSGYELVYYSYYGLDGKVHSNTIVANPGKYRKNEVIEIRMDPINFRKSAVPGPTYSFWIIGFGVLIALFVWGMVYKLVEMVGETTIRFNA